MIGVQRKPQAFDVMVRRSEPVLFLFRIWLFISSVYYIETLFSANFSSVYEEGVYHKITKYIVCFLFSLYLFFRIGNIFSLLLSVLLFLVAGFLIGEVGGLEISAITIITFAAMGGGIIVLDVWRDRADEIARVVVYSGVVVGFFSVAELTLLAERFSAYWNATDGVRSISTLYNPNNLGLYLGAGIVLLFFLDFKIFKKVLVLIPILFGFVASGSRTAWLALLITILLIISFDRRVRGLFLYNLFQYFPVWLFLLFFGVAASFFVTQYLGFDQYESQYRGVSLYTASIRWENAVRFFDLLDFDVFYPDIFGVRSDYIQDNFYLVVLNSFGLFGCIVFLLLFVARNSLRLKYSECGGWSWLVVFYLVSGFSGSFLNSFPNNQLFFIALGAFFTFSSSLKAYFSVSAYGGCKK